MSDNLLKLNENKAEILVIGPKTKREMLETAGLLEAPRNNQKKIGDADFVNYAPKLWSTLPRNIRGANSVSIFKRQLKTYLFIKAFN